MEPDNTRSFPARHDEVHHDEKTNWAYVAPKCSGAAAPNFIAVAIFAFNEHSEIEKARTAGFLTPGGDLIAAIARGCHRQYFVRNHGQLTGSTGQSG